MQPEGGSVADGEIWRWNRKRATGIVLTDHGDQVWFAVNSLRGRNFDDIAIGDRVTVEYVVAQQDSHNLRATHVRWLE